MTDQQEQNPPEVQSPEPTQAQVLALEKVKSVLMYIGTNTQELKSDLERIHKKCDLFRKNKLCVKCVLFLDARCVFWDKHYVKFTEKKE